MNGTEFYVTLFYFCIYFNSFQVLPGLYVGSYQDAKDAEKLKENSVTHIVSVYDNANALFDVSFVFLLVVFFHDFD